MEDKDTIKLLLENPNDSEDDGKLENISKTKTFGDLIAHIAEEIGMDRSNFEIINEADGVVLEKLDDEILSDILGPNDKTLCVIKRPLYLRSKRHKGAYLTYKVTVTVTNKTKEGISIIQGKRSRWEFHTMEPNHELGFALETDYSFKGKKCLIFVLALNSHPQF